jgi:hypothetical protein
MSTSGIRGAAVKNPARGVNRIEAASRVVICGNDRLANAFAFQ